MNILITLLFSKALSNKRNNYKGTSKRFKRDTKFLIQAIKELVQLINIIVKFIFSLFITVIEKCFCQTRAVESVNLPDNVIDLDKYRLKKAE